MRSSGLVRLPVREVTGTADGTRVRGLRLACLALLAFSFLPFPARAERASLRFVDAGPFLIGGQRVTVAWKDVSSDVDELELLLSVDGGEHFPVRLTRSIDPAPGSVVWTVPSLATSGARLRLRFGREGHEEDGEPSALFRIFVPPGAPPSRLERRAGECWVAGEALPVHSGIRSVEGARSAGEVEALAVYLPEDDVSGRAPSAAVAADFARGSLAAPFAASRPCFTPEPAAPKRE